jgi:hypothetical protein
VAYTASPLTGWFFIALAGIFAWAGRGLERTERRWVWSILTVAVAARVVAVAFLFLTTSHDQIASFFWDGDGAALKIRALLIRNVWLGVPIDSADFSYAFDPGYGWTSYLNLLAYLQYLLGPAPYAIHLFNIAAFTASAVLLHRLARSAYGSASALLGLAIIVFLPTLFAWSVSALKESVYVLLSAIALSATVAVIRADGVVRRLIAVLLLAGSAVIVGSVRVGGSLVVMTGLCVGVAGGTIARRVSLVILTLLLVPYAGYRTLGDADTQARIMSQLERAAVTHIGHVRTAGNHYKLLDQRFYSNSISMPAEEMTAMEGLRFTVRALVGFVIVPLPWQAQSVPEMVFLPQQVVWYVLVVLAAIGVATGLRRDPLVTCLLCGLTVAGAVAIALYSGNVGTMVRHRDTVVPFIIWLSALGATSTASTCMSRASTASSTP